MPERHEQFAINIRKIYGALNTALHDATEVAKHPIKSLPDHREVLEYAKRKIDEAKHLAEELGDQRKHVIVGQTFRHIMKFADAMNHLGSVLHRKNKIAALDKIETLKAEIRLADDSKPKAPD